MRLVAQADHIVDSALAPLRGLALSERLTPRRRRLLAAWGPVLTLGALMLALTIINSKFATAANLKTIANQSAIPLVLGVGLAMVILLGAIDLSIEGVMAATMFSVALMAANNVNDLDLGVLAVIIGLGIGAAFGVVNGVVNAYLRIPSFMVTFGTWFIGIGVAQRLLGRQPPRIDLEARNWVIVQQFGIQQMFYIALIVVALGALLLRFTRLGRHIYAIGGNEELAAQSGVHVRRVKVTVFAMAGMLSGLGGAFALGRVGVADVTASQGRLFTTIAGVVLGGTLLSGGRGGVLQSSEGIIIMIVLRNGMILSGVDPFLQDAVEGAIVIAAVIAMNWSARAKLRVVA